MRFGRPPGTDRAAPAEGHLLSCAPGAHDLPAKARIAIARRLHLRLANRGLHGAGIERSGDDHADLVQRQFDTLPIRQVVDAPATGEIQSVAFKARTDQRADNRGKIQCVSAAVRQVMAASYCSDVL